MSGSLRSHGLQHARLSCSSLSPRVCSNSCLLNQDAIQLSHPLSPLLLLLSIYPSIRVFSDESALHVKWPKYWNLSFSISPSNEYSGLIFFRMDSFDLLALQGTLTPGGCPGGGERVDRSRVKDSCYLHSPLEWSSMLRPSHLSPRFWTCPPLL